MSAGTDSVDAEIRRVLQDRLKIDTRIRGKLEEVARLRTLYAQTQDSIDGLLGVRTEVQATEARAEIERDAHALAAAVPPPAPPPAYATGGPVTPQPCTCRASGLPCPQHGRPRPSHL